MKKQNIFTFLLIITFIYIFIFSSVGIIRTHKLTQKLHSLQFQIKELEKQNKILMREIYLLKNDSDYIADLARKLGYAKKGEKIFRFKITSTNTNNYYLKKFTKDKTFHIHKEYYFLGTILIILILIYIIQGKTGK